PTAIFLSLTPLIGVTATLIWILTGNFHIQTLIFGFVLMVVAGMSITGGYHRLFSHRTYDASPFVRALYVVFGSAAFEGSVIEWSLDHRVHHQQIDKDADPYSVKDGFWHAHILWMFTERTRNLDPKAAGDLWSDPLLRWQHKHFIVFASFMSFVFPMLVAGILWGDWIGGLFVAGCMRLVLNHHATFAINSVCHVFGKQTYSDRHSARDNWFTSLYTYGEGYHNYHHEFALDYRNGIRWYDFDPTKWMIFGLSTVKLASGLKQVSPEEIMRRKAAMQERLLAEKLKGQPEFVVAAGNQMLVAAKSQLTHASEQLSKLRQQYAALKREKTAQYLAYKHERQSHLEDRYNAVQIQLKEMQVQMRAAQRDFKRSVALWQSTNRGLTKLVGA
ncbi:MAG: fatty acid desaturase, partial [Rhizobacter sp.]|nr:fatty acid desaturase [Chlorobiales bacterium]